MVTNLKTKIQLLIFLVCICMMSFSCAKEVPKKVLQPVSVADFTEFVTATNYITDAERYDWSVVQITVYDFIVRYGIDWRCPDGISYAPENHPVTQVSLNDALAYCKWSKTRLPSYVEFWELTKNDKRLIVETMPQIFPLEQVNLIGNVWDMTTTKRVDGEIRLAGGSYLCNKNTCDGTSSNRELYVDKETGNTHISFSVVLEK